MAAPLAYWALPALRLEIELEHVRQVAAAHMLTELPSDWCFDGCEAYRAYHGNRHLLH